MKNFLPVAVVIFLVIIVAGFAIGTLSPESPMLCTMMACLCTDVDGERTCNTCSYSDPVFTTGIVNVAKQCTVREIIVCENGTQVDSRYDMENKKCRTLWRIFGVDLRNLNKNSGESESTSIIRDTE